MRDRLRSRATFVLLLGLLGSSAELRAEETRLAPALFFAGSGGFANAWIDHPDIGARARPGAYVGLLFGWTLSERWAVGGEFTTWGTSPLGTPVHLHTIGPRLEFSPAGMAGLLVRSTVGYSLTEGELRARAGAGAALTLGYRWFPRRGVAIAGEAGAHGHLYGNGTAAFPFAALEVRFYGSR
jgi:hypothetical protein